MFIFGEGIGGGARMDAMANDGAAAGGAPEAPKPAEQPAQAPATPSEQQPEVPEQTGPEPVQYAETGNPSLDYVLQYVGNMGIGSDHPAMQAAVNGDFDLLGVELAKADAKGAENILAMAKRTYEDMVSQTKARNTELKNKVHTIAGGEEQWQEVSAWAADNASEDERSAINTLFEQGGVAAEIAASYLVSQYRGATGTQFEGKPAVQQAAATPTPKNEPLTNAQFAAEASKLYRQYGNSYSNTPEYRALAARIKR